MRIRGRSTRGRRAAEGDFVAIVRRVIEIAWSLVDVAHDVAAIVRPRDDDDHHLVAVVR